ncbi:MAG TPA: hypothetical protein VL137_17310 [Polyangiaceae bacterium]|nr:hypothetical protein [Polyangiaceae bacterium]
MTQKPTTTTPKNTRQTVQQSIPSQPALFAPLGAAAPTLLRAASPDGRWVALCQARVDSNADGALSVEVGPHGELFGDHLQSYWVYDHGTGLLIDQFVGSSPDGRYVATIEKGGLLLRDTTGGTVTNLSERGADLRNDQAPLLGPRILRFDPTGRRLLYLRHSDNPAANAEDHIVVRDLSSGAERDFSSGEGLFWRADFDATGEFVVTRVITADTNKNKHLDWPYPLQTESNPGCTGPLPSFAVWEYPGDQPAVRIFRMSDSKFTDAPGFVSSFGAGWITRDDQHALNVNGVQTPFALSNADCDARVLHSDPLRQLAVVACMGAKGGPELELVGPGYRAALNLQVSSFEVDIELPGMPFLVPLYAKKATSMLDLDTRVAYALEESDWVEASYGKRALIRRNDALYAWDNGILSPTFGKLLPMRPVLQQGAMVLVPPLLVDLETESLVGQVEDHVLALTEHGALLEAASYPTTPTTLPQGPLRWLPPPRTP